MPDISLAMIVVLCVAALAAGWIDAVVGGGGLLLLPALLLGLPANTPAAYALGREIRHLRERETAGDRMTGHRVHGGGRPLGS